MASLGASLLGGDVCAHAPFGAQPAPARTGSSGGRRTGSAHALVVGGERAGAAGHARARPSCPAGTCRRSAAPPRDSRAGRQQHRGGEEATGAASSRYTAQKAVRKGRHACKGAAATAEALRPHEVQRREEVLGGLGPADLQHGAVGPPEQLGGARPAVVVEAHGVAVSAAVVDDHHVARQGLGIQGPVHSKLVVVLAECPHHVEDARLRDEIGRVLGDMALARGQAGQGPVVAEDADVVVGAVHPRAHEVHHAGVYTHVVLVDPLPVHDPRDQEPRGSCDVAPALHDDPKRREPPCLDQLLVDLVHPCPDGGHVHLRVPGPVRDANPAPKVNHLDANAELVVHGADEGEEHAGRLHNLVDLEAVRHNHRMQAETPHAELLAAPVAFQQLGARCPKLGFLGVSDEHIPSAARSGIVAETDEFREAELPVEELDMREVVQVHHSAGCFGNAVLLQRCVVAREHDLLPPEPHPPREDDLRGGGTVHAASLLLEHPEDVRIRRRLHGKVVPEAWAPSKGRQETADLLPDRALVVNVEGGGEAAGQLQHLLFCPGEVCDPWHGARTPRL
eukprot:CAMPEP_0175735670 /NCGR_PEP_ID=MMETSP0097-20121207/53020_1 /TAXON_ID=311494 /ORGANISM="Alexandrium monilatum, Strain CCMP3105" /LENGTH=564 /DNA_ID=CAMNT_0017043733 /DNA_START=233 /DNA_END=1927 /DNA_ORIENTATION=+